MLGKNVCEFCFLLSALAFGGGYWVGGIFGWEIPWWESEVLDGAQVRGMVFSAIFSAVFCGVYVIFDNSSRDFFELVGWYSSFIFGIALAVGCYWLAFDFWGGGDEPSATYLAAMYWGGINSPFLLSLFSSIFFTMGGLGVYIFIGGFKYLVLNFLGFGN